MWCDVSVSFFLGLFEERLSLGQDIVQVGNPLVLHPGTFEFLLGLCHTRKVAGSFASLALSGIQRLIAL